MNAPTQAQRDGDRPVAADLYPQNEEFYRRKKSDFDRITICGSLT